jgi:RNA polymerase sigma-70 factor (ECF subfamily)
VDFQTLSDEALLVLIARRHDDALHELYNRYHRLVFSLALTVVNQHATAEEITLDVFTRVWQKAESYQPDRAQVNTWLTSIARNHAIDVLRRQSTRAHFQTVSWADAPPDIVPTAEDPADSAHLLLLQQRVRAAVAQLPPDQQEALALAYFKGHSHRQIADLLDVPLGTIKTRIRSALKKLRETIPDES